MQYQLFAKSILATFLLGVLCAPVMAQDTDDKNFKLDGIVLPQFESRPSIKARVLSEATKKKGATQDLSPEQIKESKKIADLAEKVAGLYNSSLPFMTSEKTTINEAVSRGSRIYLGIDASTYGLHVMNSDAIHGVYPRLELISRLSVCGDPILLGLITSGGKIIHEMGYDLEANPVNVLIDDCDFGD